MSKAEDGAIEKYPVEMYEDVGWRCIDKNANKRQYFIEGYRQAEKDLELTWEDVKAIFLLVQVEWSPNKNEEEIYQEVLKRFKEIKKYDT